VAIAGNDEHFPFFSRRTPVRAALRSTSTLGTFERTVLANLTRTPPTADRGRHFGMPPSAGQPPKRSLDRQMLCHCPRETALPRLAGWRAASTSAWCQIKPDYGLGARASRQIHPITSYFLAATQSC
jgi:hypothetical protein